MIDASPIRDVPYAEDTMDADDRDEIAHRAHERFQARGGEHGHDQEDWFEAEREIRQRSGTQQRDRKPAGAINRGAGEDRREQSVTGGRATRGRGVEGAPLNKEAAVTSGTGPTSTPTGTGPGGNVRTPGTAVSGGPTEGGR